MIIVKKLGEDDWETYRDIRLEALKNDPSAFGSCYSEEEKFPENKWRERIKNALFAMDGKKAVGTIVVFFENYNNLKHIAHIYGVYVKPDYRGKGVSKMLMGAALENIKSNKEIIKVKLEVNAKQKPAYELYKKYGFKKIGITKKELKVDNKFYDEVLMEKFI